MNNTIAIMSALALGVALHGPVSAQGDATTLDRIDSLVARSRFRDAVAALDAWERAHTGSKTTASRATSADRARALMLRARLTQSSDSVRTIYVDLAASYPSSPEAPIALLRLAQLAYAEDDTLRALSYIQRLARDYQSTDANREAADIRSRLGSQQATPQLAPQSQRQSPPQSQPQRQSQPQSTATPPPPPTKTAPPRDSAFALQIGAFKDANSAATVSRQLAKRGFEARVVTVPGSTLSRVRVGRFVTSRAADDLVRRLRSAGYEAVVVDDALKESRTPK
jgi:cell division septation protein DedD